VKEKGKIAGTARPKGCGYPKKKQWKLLGAVNEPPCSNLRGIWSLILPLPAMGGDQGEGDASDISAFHHHLSPQGRGTYKVTP
jgi:hypothetical protein